MNSTLRWLIDQRASARIAFALRTVCMGLSGLLSLVWTPLLLRALGAEKYGTWTAFSAVVGLAAAGEFGLGGAVSLRTNQLIAAGDLDGLRRLHAVARGVFVVLAGVLTAVALALSPWLPGWLGFQQSAGAGPLAWLFAAGAVAAGLAVLASYVNSSIYAAGSVMWPVVPAFVFSQAALALGVLLGWLGKPLWILQSAGVVLAVVSLGAMFFLYRHSHPVFREALPWRWDGALLRELAGTSFWAYLLGLTTIIFTSTDRLVVNAFFGAGAVPAYQLNYKLCELALALIITASAVSLPKVVNLLLGSEPAARQHGTSQVARLAQVQGLLGFAACVAYIAGNDLFIRLLFGAEYQAPLVIQAAFVTSLLLASNSDIFIQLCGRLAAAGLRFGAVALLVSALVNLALSLLAAAWLRWLPGVAWATFAAQVGAFFAVAEYVRQRDALGARGPIVWRSFFAPLLLLALALAAKAVLPAAWGLAGVAALGAIGLALLAVYARLIGLGWREVKEEGTIVLRLLGIGRQGEGGV